MAMKIPTFEAQTKLTGEVGNSPLSIQANPGAMSQGAVAQANFGGQVSQLGGQVFEMGVKLQEIKNTSESQRIELEYKRIDSEITSRAALLPDNIDIQEWSKTEKLKAQISLTNGQSYTLKSLGGGEDLVFNVNAETGEAYPIVKNKAVKSSVKSVFSLQDNLSNAALTKIAVTRYTNRLTTEFETKKDILIEDAVLEHDTPNGAVAIEQLFGENGLFDQKNKAGIYADPSDLLKDMRETQTSIADLIAEDMIHQLVQQDDPDNNDALEESLSNFSDDLFKQDPETEAFVNFPLMSLDQRSALRDKIDKSIIANMKTNNSLSESEYKRIKRKREKAQDDQYDKFKGEIVNGHMIFDGGRLDIAWANKKIDDTQYKALGTALKNLKTGNNNVTSSANQVTFINELDESLDKNDLLRLKKENHFALITGEINNTDWKNRDRLLKSAIDNDDTIYGETIKRFATKLRSIANPFGGDFAGFDSLDDKARVSIMMNTFYDSVSQDEQGVYPTKDLIEKAFNNARDGFHQTLSQEISNMQSLPVTFGDDVINAFKTITETDISYTPEEILPIIKSNPVTFENQMRQAFASLSIEEQDRRRRSFNGNLSYLISLGKAFDASKRYNLSSEPLPDVK